MAKNSNTVLSIKVSKINEKGPLAAEQMFASLHGILSKTNVFSDQGQSNERFSFEIAAYDGNIFFYVWVPIMYREFIEGQIYAQYPDIEITEVQDYIPKNLEGRSNILGEVVFTKHRLFPLKRFEEFEEKIAKMALDPLSSITEALSKTEEDELSVLQIVTQPVSDKWWKTQAEKVIKQYSKGRNPFLFNDKYCIFPRNPLGKILLFPFKPYTIHFYVHNDRNFH